MKGDRLRETLRRAAGGEPGAADAWVGFQRRLARAARWRNASVAVAGLAAAATLAIVLPGLNSGPRDTLSIGPSQPGPQPMLRYTDEVAGFTLLYPADWIGDGSDGGLAHFRPRETPPHESEDDFEPPGLAGSWDPGREGFAVQIGVYSSNAVIPRQGPMVEQVETWADHGARVTDSELRLGDLAVPLHRIDFPANWIDPETKEEEPGQTPGVWCSRCTVELATLDLGDGLSIEMRLLGPTEGFDEHRSTGVRLLESIERIARRTPSPRSS